MFFSSGWAYGSNVVSVLFGINYFYNQKKFFWSVNLAENLVNLRNLKVSAFSGQGVELSAERAS